MPDPPSEEAQGIDNSQRLADLTRRTLYYIILYSDSSRSTFARVLGVGSMACRRAQSLAHGTAHPSPNGLAPRVRHETNVSGQPLWYPGNNF
jgi:hypothetical protein